MRNDSIPDIIILTSAAYFQGKRAGHISAFKVGESLTLYVASGSRLGDSVHAWRRGSLPAFPSSLLANADAGNMIADMIESPIGHRIHVIGNSCSGKSTLGAQLAALLNVPCVELDALNWEPDWVGLNEVNPQELERRIQAATAGDGWVVAGSYARFCQKICWPRLQTLVWLDLPLPQLVWRMTRRSWQRWRSRELLWGTNYEQFWPQFMVWRKQESLLWWIVTQHQRKRQRLLSYYTDPQWQHIRIIRLGSVAEIEAFKQSIARLSSKAE